MAEGSVYVTVQADEINSGIATIAGSGESGSINTGVTIHISNPGGITSGYSFPIGAGITGEDTISAAEEKLYSYLMNMNTTARLSTILSWSGCYDE